MKKKLNNKTYDKILTTAYFIVLNVFKKNISKRQSMASKTLKYSSLSSSDKAKCNDLVQKVLRFTVYLDPWINRNKKGRLRIEVFCLVRLALVDILVRNVRQETVLKKYSELASSFERTKHSKDQLRYFIHLGYSVLKKKSLEPSFLFESKIRKVLSSQYSLEIIKRVEKIFSDSAPIDLSIKSSASEENYFKQLKGNSVNRSHFRLSQKTSLIKTKGYCAGDWWVQSLAASLPVKIAPMALKEKIVLDVCCAPGGKSFQLADNGANLTSIDKSERRLKVMKENLHRLKYDLDLICADIFEYQPKKLFDIILLDPPCTATGTIGKNPDLQFLNPLDKLEELSDIQQKMLTRCASWLQDDGYIIYSVCSLLKQEGEDQISRFLKKNKEFCLIHPKKKGYLDQEGYENNKESGIRIMPFFEEGLGGTEGFFIAYLHLKGKSN
ncbi:RsmB/NOP family class I SAM-dependent RNA methyltransferase [Paracoccaceae bacterium]|nr:RsmB/NOP family class I SAM-dependent RNA methyltransferase [Paracoccaceae bacterium]